MDLPKAGGDPTEPKLGRLSLFPLFIAFWNRGLDDEVDVQEPSKPLRPDGLPLPDNGELLGLIGLPFLDPDDMRYFGGVI